VPVSRGWGVYASNILPLQRFNFSLRVIIIIAKYMSFKHFSCQTLQCKKYEFFKKTKVQELKYFYLTYKIQTIKADVPIKVKYVVAFYD
jgi:hypothetical protein